MPIAWSTPSAAAWRAVRASRRPRRFSICCNGRHGDLSDREPVPGQLAANDPAKPPQLPAGATPPQLAAWTAVARVLLNLDETITKE